MVIILQEIKVWNPPRVRPRDDEKEEIRLIF